MTRLSYLACACLLGLGCSGASAAPAGELDPDFGAAQTVRIGFNLGANNTDTPRALAIDALGQIVVGGTASTATGLRMVMARLTADGYADDLFFGDGTWVHPEDSFSGSGASLVVTLDGACMVGGRQALATTAAYAACPPAAGAVAGYQSAIGDLTLSWHAATAGVHLGAYDYFEVVGSKGIPGSKDIELLRLQLGSNGVLAPDPVFGVGGYVHVNEPGGRETTGAAILRVPQYGYYVAGDVRNDTGDHDFAAISLNVLGQMDATFDGDGMRFIAFDSGGFNDDHAVAIARDAEGRLLVAGTASRDAEGNDLDVALVRVLPDGSDDVSFGPEGKRLYSFSATNPTLRDEVSAVLVDDVGRIYVVGTLHIADPVEGSIISIMRLTASGELDKTFGLQGRKLIDFVFGRGVAIAMQGDMPVVLAEITLSEVDTDFLVFRLLPEGDLVFADGFETP